MLVIGKRGNKICKNWKKIADLNFSISRQILVTQGEDNTLSVLVSETEAGYRSKPHQRTVHVRDLNLRLIMKSPL